MDQHRVRAGLARLNEELLAGGDTGDQLGDVGPAFDLQSVGAEVATSTGFEKPVEVADQLRKLHGGSLRL